MEPLRQEENEGLSCSIDRQPEFRSEPDDRTDVDNGALPGCHEAWCDRAREARQCRGVKADDFGHLVRALIDKCAGGRGTRVIDQYAYARIVAQPCRAPLSTSVRS